MDNNKPDDLLQQLHDVISNIQTVDEKGYKMLEDIDQDIRALLERSGEQSTKAHASMMRSLERAIGYFEVTHPDLTDLLAKVMSSLSNAGV
jgi:DNA-binding winged helix-turn-helix (wHTH) protein